MLYEDTKSLYDRETWAIDTNDVRGGSTMLVGFRSIFHVESAID